MQCQQKKIKSRAINEIKTQNIERGIKKNTVVLKKKIKMSTEGDFLRSLGRRLQTLGPQWLKADPLVRFRCNLWDN